MKEPNCLKMYNWTIIKIIIYVTKKVSKGRPSNIKTVCSDRRLWKMSQMICFKSGYLYIFSIF